MGLIFISITATIVGLFLAFKMQAARFARDDKSQSIAKIKIEELNFQQYKNKGYKQRKVIISEILNILAINKQIFREFIGKNRNWSEGVEGPAYEKIFKGIQYQILEYTHDCYREDFEHFKFPNSENYTGIIANILIGLKCLTGDEDYLPEFVDLCNKITKCGTLLNIIFSLFGKGFKSKKFEVVQSAGERLLSLGSKILVLFDSTAIQKQHKEIIENELCWNDKMGALSNVFDKYIEIFKDYVDCFEIYYENISEK